MISAQLTDVEQHSAFAPLALRTWLERVGEQVGNARHGRIYPGLGRLVPGGAVGNPKTYHDIQPMKVSFLSRTGAERLSVAAGRELRRRHHRRTALLSVH